MVFLTFAVRMWLLIPQPWRDARSVGATCQLRGWGGPGIGSWRLSLVRWRAALDGLHIWIGRVQQWLPHLVNFTWKSNQFHVAVQQTDVSFQVWVWLIKKKRGSWKLHFISALICLTPVPSPVHALRNCKSMKVSVLQNFSVLEAN